MKTPLFLFAVLLTIACFSFSGCDIEGLDASLFNNVNELVISGHNSGNFDFDHLSTLMIVHLHKQSDFGDKPTAQLTLDWVETDAQNNRVPVNETKSLFFDAVSPGDYYARAFIDINRNSAIDVSEPFAIWLDQDGFPKIIPVREESRWKVAFYFNARYPASS